MNKKILFIFTLIGLGCGHSFGIVYTASSSLETSCPGASVSVDYYIPTSSPSLTIYPVDAVRNDTLSFVRNEESTVKVWKNNAGTLSNCTNWYRGSNVIPGDGKYYYALGTDGCALNKVARTDPTLPAAQIVYNVAFKTETGKDTGTSSYFYREYFGSVLGLGPLTNLPDQTKRTWGAVQMHGNECFNIYTHWCGDGILDASFGETCEPSLNPSCSASCTLPGTSSSGSSGSGSSGSGSSGSGSSGSGSGSSGSGSSGSGGSGSGSSGSGSSGGFADSPDCEYVDPPSVNLNEYIPIWWKLKSDIWTTNCDANNLGKYNSSTTSCKFTVTNGIGEQDSFNKLCFNNNWSNLAQGYITDRGSLSNYDGKTEYLVSSSKFSGLGETKILLNKVNYYRCETDNNGGYRFNPGVYTGTVCAMNFFVTRPYVFQEGSALSTVDNDLLGNFYKMNGNRIISSSDLRNITVSSYTGGSNMSFILNNFINKYDTLAVSNISYLATHGIYNLRKVSNQNIYIIENGPVSISSNASFTSPTTIIVKNGDLHINDNISGPGMYIVPNGKIYFKTNDCDTQQSVEGIFIGKSFDTDWVQNNNLSSNNWCYDGRLKIKGVIKSIENSVSNLWTKRRSVVNDYFVSGNTQQKIYNGASALITSNPSLWLKLPPGADDLLSDLKIEKK